MTHRFYALLIILNLSTAAFYAWRIFDAPTPFLGGACVAFAVLAGFNSWACYKAGDAP